VLTSPGFSIRRISSFSPRFDICSHTFLALSNDELVACLGLHTFSSSSLLAEPSYTNPSPRSFPTAIGVTAPMDFDHYGQSSQQPRQRRKRVAKRRLCNKPPVAARLALDAQLRGNVGLLSEDLAKDLFPQQSLQGESRKG
jgi:hypothetical protein